MAKKEIWDDSTLFEELAKARDVLESIPQRHLRKVIRALVLRAKTYEYSLTQVRGTTSESIALQMATLHGQIGALREVSANLESILDGTFKRSDELEMDPEVEDARESWREGTDAEWNE